jgi:small-conductance mechanosensitive channel
VSIFLGVLFSLGSTSAIANLIAGLVITYMRAFKIGDRVKIGDDVGDVIEKKLLLTRIRTIKNEDITIPNSTILSRHTINFSSASQSLGLILHTTVTIGYDAPWRTVHQLLISAAKNTPGILDQPEPFVLQTSLDNSYVSYQINAYTNEPNRMAEIYSGLHQNIQDKFNEAKVEIMSPHYQAIRDGNQTTIPADYLPQEYQAPAFRISKINDEKSDQPK